MYPGSSRRESKRVHNCHLGETTVNQPNKTPFEKKSRKLFFRFTRGVICNLNIDTDVGQLLEEPKNIVYSFLKEKEDLGPSILSPCSYSPSKVPVRLPGGSVEMWSEVSFGGLGKDTVPDTREDTRDDHAHPVACYS